MRSRPLKKFYSLRFPSGGEAGVLCHTGHMGNLWDRSEGRNARRAWSRAFSAVFAERNGRGRVGKFEQV